MSSSVIFWTEFSCWRKSCSNKATLLLGWSHRCKNSTVVITIWLIDTKYSYRIFFIYVVFVLSSCHDNTFIRLFLSNTTGVLYEPGIAYPSLACACANIINTELYIWLLKCASYDPSDIKSCGNVDGRHHETHLKYVTLHHATIWKYMVSQNCLH